MSQVIRKLSVFASIAMIVLAWACSDSRESGGQFNVETGKHTSAVWLPQGHATAGTTSCTECHGDDLAGGISKVSCSSCHLGGPTAVHPASWIPVYLTHGKSVSTGATTTAQCANKYCHGINLEGVTNSGPSCTSCHSMPFDPATLVCATCHSIPPSGTASPNRDGKHSKHSTSARTSCDICHNGASAYKGNHSNNAVDFSFQAAYIPKSGGALSYDTSTNTCANMSCHGAQATPSWLTGSLNVNTQCSSCHAYGTTQYNSFNSGEHDKHVNQKNIGCIVCHDTGKLAANHFTTLNTRAMEGPASATLQIQTGYNGNSCNPSAGGLSGCHSQENWFCSTCHGIPPSGTASPNRAGKHSKHSTSARISCDICHDGSSAYAANHSNGLLDLSFQAAYIPKSGGIPSYDASTNTCTNMSCHGAQVTPSWLTGSLNVNTQCSACHAYGTTQYNSFNSGRHDKHVNEENIGCTVCHDTAKLAPNHFIKLNTPAMEGPASATLQTQTGYNGNSCNPRAGGLSGCHSQENWW